MERARVIWSLRLLDSLGMDGRPHGFKLMSTVRAMYLRWSTLLTESSYERLLFERWMRPLAFSMLSINNFSADCSAVDITECNLVRFWVTRGWEYCLGLIFEMDGDVLVTKWVRSPSQLLTRSKRPSLACRRLRLGAGIEGVQFRQAYNNIRTREQMRVATFGKYNRP